MPNTCPGTRGSWCKIFLPDSGNGVWASHTCFLSCVSRPRDLPHSDTAAPTAWREACSISAHPELSNEGSEALSANSNCASVFVNASNIRHSTVRFMHKCISIKYMYQIYSVYILAVGSAAQNAAPHQPAQQVMPPQFLLVALNPSQLNLHLPY